MILVKREIIFRPLFFGDILFKILSAVGINADRVKPCMNGSAVGEIFFIIKKAVYFKNNKLRRLSLQRLLRYNLVKRTGHCGKAEIIACEAEFLPCERRIEARVKLACTDQKNINGIFRFFKISSYVYSVLIAVGTQNKVHGENNRR